MATSDNALKTTNSLTTMTYHDTFNFLMSLLANYNELRFVLHEQKGQWDRRRSWVQPRVKIDSMAVSQFSLVGSIWAISLVLRLLITSLSWTHHYTQSRGVVNTQHIGKFCTYIYSYKYHKI